MRHAKGIKPNRLPKAFFSIPLTVGLAACAAVWSGCGGSSPSTARDDRFASQTFDENTEPLTNAIVGTPAGTFRVDSSGAMTPMGGGPAVDAGVADSGVTTPAGMGAPPPAVDAGVGFVEDAGPGPFPDDGGVGDGGASGGFGMWHFDDCSPSSHFLADSSGAGANAQQALNAACVPGISNLGVLFRSPKDVVQVPDEPQFAVGSRVAVAAWVHPNTVTGDQPIVLKRLNNKTAFSLGVHKGNVVMSVVLGDGTTVSSQAPIKAGTWSHVAGMFDGTFVYLFIDGQQFGQVYGAGVIRDVFAPIRIGATTQSQYFDGIIDEVFVSTQAISKDALMALACISNPATLSVSPPTSGPVQADTTFTYTVAVQDNDIGFCPDANLDFFPQFAPANISESVPVSFATTAPGQTATFTLDVTANDEALPGTYQLPFTVDVFGGNSFNELFGNLTFELAQPTGCFVTVDRELMITDTSVVDDPVRTFGVSSPPFPTPDGGVGFVGGGSSGASAGSGSSSFSSGGGSVGDDAGGPLQDDATAPPQQADAAPPQGPDVGVWTFGHLLRDMAPTPAAAPAMVEHLFDQWLTDQRINGFIVAARPAMQQTLLDVWPRTPDGQLDLDHPPLTLQAIVDRIDLRNLANGSAGEGRFVFAVNGQGGFPLNFTVILEYNLPAQTPQDVATWAKLWHGLQSHPFPSEEYNAALEAVTSRFAARNAAPNGVNGSALLTLRTNEQALSPVGDWELREFALSPSTGLLEETTVKETPDLGFNGTQQFADFVNQDSAAIVALVPGATGVLPASFEGAPFMAGSVLNKLVEWSAPGITNEDARFHASMNTCNGCHGPEVNVSFLQITPRSPGSQATLSPFLLGTTVTGDAGVTRTLNDLERRRLDLAGLVCGSGDGGGVSPPDAAAASH